MKGTRLQENGYGSLIRYGYGAISYHHNLYADNYSRNPRPGDNLQLDFINNVVSTGAFRPGYNEDDATDNPGGYTNYLNYIGNYFIVGNDTTANPDIAFQSGVPDPAFTQIYQSTNFIDTNAFNIVLDGADTGWGMFSGLLTQLGSPNPMPEIPVTTNSPAFAYEQVLAFAGASVAGVTAAGPWPPARPCCATRWTPTSSPASATRAARSLTLSALTASPAFTSAPTSA